jgi:hypothetical protein
MNAEALIDSLIDYSMAVEAWGGLEASDAAPPFIQKSALDQVIRAAEHCQANQPQGELTDAWQRVVAEWLATREARFPPQKR